MAAFVDDKSPICIPFILDRLAEYRRQQSEGGDDGDGRSHRPFVVGINGVQGVGKTTLVAALAAALNCPHESSSPPQKEETQHSSSSSSSSSLCALVVSIDDFYLTHADQRALAAAHPDNRLVQVRGEPGTHDTRLLAAFMDAVCAGRPAHVPEYDKAAFSGQGDRLAPAPGHPGRPVNGSGEPPVQVLIVEGWCVGFRKADPAVVEVKWRQALDGAHAAATSTTAAAATAAATGGHHPSQLPAHKLEHLLFVNDQLAAYEAALTDRLDAFIHLDAEHTPYVYAWRREQEAALRASRGAGMTDAEVDRFVDAYYPAYELFADGTRQGVFGPGRPGRQLRLVVGRDRRVKQTIVI